jgi:hypothetical protein
MPKLKKTQLVIDDVISFDMVGVCSHHSDYRLVWGINDSMGIRLEKASEDFVVRNRKGEEVSSHAQYKYYDPNDRLEYYFVKNKSNGMFLIPEKPSIDYFLFLYENVAVEVDDFASKLRDVSSVLGVYLLDAQEIKSAESLEFS